MAVDSAISLFCACGKAHKGKSLYCSDSCRAKASHARRFIKRAKRRKPTTPDVYRRLALWLEARCGA